MVEIGMLCGLVSFDQPSFKLSKVWFKGVINQLAASVSNAECIVRCLIGTRAVPNR